VHAADAAPRSQLVWCASSCAHRLRLLPAAHARHHAQRRDLDLQWGGSREATLLESCREALASADERAFATAVAEFDALTRLDTWKTNMLLRVKRRLQARQAGEEAGAGSEDELL
jgi:hypothetical protein